MQYDPSKAEAKTAAIPRGHKSLKELWRLPGGPLFLFICLLGALGITYAVLSAFGIDLYSKLGLTKLRCVFHSMTGLYCPGCGGTRSTLMLLTLHPVRSIMYHPVPVFVAALAVNFFVRFFFAYLVPEKCPVKLKPAKPRLLYIFILAGLYILHFIVRNALLLGGIDTLAL